jgi:hypothetical protein
MHSLPARFKQHTIRIFTSKRACNRSIPFRYGRFFHSRSLHSSFNESGGVQRSPCPFLPYCTHSLHLRDVPFPLIAGLLDRVFLTTPSLPPPVCLLRILYTPCIWVSCNLPPHPCTIPFPPNPHRFVWATASDWEGEGVMTSCGLF